MKTFNPENPVLRQHQSDALAAIQLFIEKREGKGKIILPTGTGKTRIEAEVVCRIIKYAQEKGEWGGIHVILSPRILLAYQQLDEFLKFIGREGINCDYMVVNSGGLDSKRYEEKLLKLGLNNLEEIDSTTSKDVIVGKVLMAEKKNIPLIIFSTYHSVDRVEKAAGESGLEVYSYIFDEAQYCVSGGDFQNTLDFDSCFKFFFTATEKITDDENGNGMNNEVKFGEMIFTEKPRTLIERGEMASVAIHEVGAVGKGIKRNEYESMAKAVFEALDAHRVVLKRFSFRPKEIGPKLIVICDSQSSLYGIMQSKIKKAYMRSHPSVNICALSSDFGIEVDGEFKPRANNKTKEFLLATMKKWKSKDEAIVFHVDMIAEGLDVPGITAIMPFRSFSKNKFLQNLGRGTRLINVDRIRLYSGEISPKELMSAKKGGKYVKPYCWLILPVLSEDYIDMRARYREYIYTLRADYGFDSKELVIIDNVGSPPIGVQPLKWTKQDKGLVKELVHTIENEEEMRKLRHAADEVIEHSDFVNVIKENVTVRMGSEMFD